jgi:hypothetical protein
MQINTMVPLTLSMVSVCGFQGAYLYIPPCCRQMTDTWWIIREYIYVHLMTMFPILVWFVTMFRFNLHGIWALDQNTLFTLLSHFSTVIWLWSLYICHCLRVQQPQLQHPDMDRLLCSVRERVDVTKVILAALLFVLAQALNCNVCSF